MRLLVATTNQNKVREIRQLLAGAAVDIVTLAEWPDLVAPEETGRTFEENARAKALYYAAATGELTVAEDSGLAIDALDGAPGVESARFGGADRSYPEKFALIGEALRAKGDPESTARFVCALALVRGGQVLFETRGTVEGRISPEPKGTAASATIRFSSIRPTARRSPKPATPRPPSAIAAKRSGRCAPISNPISERALSQRRDSMRVPSAKNVKKNPARCPMASRN